MDTLYPVNAVAGAPAYSGRALRQANSVFLAGAISARPLGARSGVRPGTPISVGATSTSWYCNAIAGVIDAEAANEAGPYVFAFDAPVTGTVVAANASNPRVDIIYVQVDDPSEADGTSVPAVRIGYLDGVAAASPVPKPAPARSFVVAQINVPKSGGGVPTVSWVAPYAVAAGGILPIDTLANLNLLVGAAGQHAFVYADSTSANNGDYAWDGGKWARPAFAMGQLGYAQVTAVIPGFIIEGALPGLSVAVKVASGRRIKITGSLEVFSSVAGDNAAVSITQDGSKVQDIEATMVQANTQLVMERSIVLSPTAGSHTYALTLRRTTGTGTLSVRATSAIPSFILVEDIGAV